MTAIRNKRLRNARLWAHDRLCRSGCEGPERDDHARRTTHEWARALADGSFDEHSLRFAIHRLWCLRECPNPQLHAAQVKPEAVAELRDLLDVEQVVRVHGGLL